MIIKKHLRIKIFAIKKLHYMRKNFYQMSKTRKKIEHVIYYCTWHNKKIDSNKYTSNGNKKKQLM